MKKNKLMRLASGLMVAVLLTTCAISGTFAKYTSSATGTATATVAKWDVKVNDSAFADNMTFSLFDSSANYDEAGNDVSDGLIAPGTLGDFSIKVTNASEVTASYVLTLSLPAGTTLPVKFYSDSARTTELDTDADGNFVTDATTVAIGDDDTTTIYWAWDFERGTTDTDKATNNTADTALGVAASDIDIDVAITATQVD